MNPPASGCISPRAMLRGVRAKVARRRRGDQKPVVVAVPPDTLAVLTRGVDGGAPGKAGMLVKYTNAFKGWKPRYFTLDTGVLTYISRSSDDDTLDSNPGSSQGFGGPGDDDNGSTTSRRKALKRRIAGDRDQKDRDIKGVIDVQFAVVTEDDSDPSRFAIDTGHTVYHLRAQTREERDDWVRVLHASKRYFTSLAERAALRSSRLRSAAADDSGHRGPLVDEPAVAPAGATDVAAPASDATADASVEATQPERPARVDRAEEHGLAPAPGQPHVPGHQAPATANVVLPLSSLLNTAPSVSTMDTQLEDDGVSEAAANRRALVTELRRVRAHLASGHDSALSELFYDVEAAVGLHDLVNWVLHVLQTDRALVDRRVATGVTQALRRVRAGRGYLYHDDAGGEAYFVGHDSELEEVPSDDDEDFDESEYHDARSRAASDHGFQRPGQPCGTDIEFAEDMQDVRMNDVDADDVRAGALALHGEKEKLSRTSSRSSTHGERRVSRVDTMRLATAAGRSPRTRLPPLPGPPPKLNVWGILKDAVGKDLSKISIPVGLNEPTSFLQRLAEDIEYCELLDQAAAEPNQHRRLLLVAAMIISHLNSTQNRVGKPFNPLLGETFSLVMPNKGRGVRFLAEQVSHHPPVSACYAEGSGASWKYYNSIEVKNKFWGKSLEVFPVGLNHIEIPEYGDHYEFEQVTSCVHNIVIGKMWLDNYGEMEILNRTTGDRCVVKFHKSGWLSDSKSLGTVTGVVFDADGAAKHKLCGRWIDAVYEELPRQKRKLLWQAQRRPPLSASNDYNMTQWAIALNQPVAPADRPHTAPTDSRLRPDQRALENGNYELASKLKTALEDGQRARRRAMEVRGEKWSPRWFTYREHPERGMAEYVYNGKYFNAKAEGDWTDVEDIFACANGVVAPPS